MRERVSERSGMCTAWAYGSLFVRFGPFSHSVTPTGLLSELVLLGSESHTHTHTNVFAKTHMGEPSLDSTALQSVTVHMA